MDQILMDRNTRSKNDEEQAPRNEPKRKRGLGYLLLIGLLVLFVIAAVVGLMLRASERHAL
ncbi:MAG TPA: hypothetical protein VGN39_04485, partial [Terriglobales bacterium]|nr:hypothetical protein [Terriglobales bacterium]